MMSLSDDKQADIIKAFNTISRFLDEILNINNIYFDDMVKKYTMQSFNLKQIPLILKRRSWTCVYSFIMIFFLTKIYDKHDDLILKLSISLF